MEIQKTNNIPDEDIQALLLVCLCLLHLGM